MPDMPDDFSNVDADYDGPDTTVINPPPVPIPTGH
jgi:hypothetical protein